MHPIQLLRKKDPALRAALARRPQPLDWSAFDALEARRSALQSACETALAARRRTAEAVAQAKREQAPPATLEALIAEGARLAQELPAHEAALREAEQNQHAWAEQLPNVPAPEVPDGRGDNDNRVVSVVGTPPTDATGLDHVALARRWGRIDTERGAALAGSRFAVLEGTVARLHRALAQMMLDLHVERGYREVNVPLLVNASAMRGTGQLPKFAEDLFRTEDGLYLIPTAEVPVTNLLADRILEANDVPLAWVSHTACFRREAGAAGRDMHGLIRQHQFEKVELVRVEHPSRSEATLVEELVPAAAAVLDALDLPYRTVELCTGDLGFSARRTFDLEVWLPSQNAYREISSCSNMGDFQARRMNARLRDGKALLHPHTLNGSGVAVGRALVAVLENHAREDGSLAVPERLRPYLRGQTSLPGEALGHRPHDRSKN